MSDTLEQKLKLNKQLWDIANVLRGKVNADEYRDYILGFIFYKYLSERQESYANKLLATEKVKDFRMVKDSAILQALREESLDSLGYFLEPQQLFSHINQRGQAQIEALAGDKPSPTAEDYILDDLRDILRHIEQSTMGRESEEDFHALFEDIDLHSTKIGRSVAARNEVVVSIFHKLSQIDFRLEDSKSDVLGDAYEFLIGKFAAGAGKSAGEFYTPQSVSTILARIVTTDKRRIRAAYDPTCGSGSLLLRVAKEANVAEFCGQELTRTTYNLARMNMILHGIHFRNFSIRHENTLTEPQHLERRFDAIVANPPFSARWKGDDNPLNATDERFSAFGRRAPKTKADYAFLQHMYHQLSEEGTIASVFPHGVLFRGAAEGQIRRYFIEKLNAIDAVIGLPANIFYGTSIPTCILVLKKCRKTDDNIIFIDASGEGNYVKEGNQNVLREEDINLIVKTYRQREGLEKYSHAASLTEVAENDFNLNIPRYVDTFEEEPSIDLQNVADQLKTLDGQLATTQSSIKDFCDELGIPSPFQTQ